MRARFAMLCSSLLLPLGLIHCGDDTTGSGGSSQAGKAGTSRGGKSGTGGVSGTGGLSTGGSNTGGSNTGGSSTGGSTTGGRSTGGSNTGGRNTGGSNTGGKAGTGGSNTGGKAGTGGSNTGGSNTGGKAGSSNGGKSGGAGKAGSGGTNAGRGGTAGTSGNSGNGGTAGSGTAGKGGTSGSSAGHAGAGGASASPTASELLAKLGSCNAISNGKYSSDTGTAAAISVCQLNGAIFWQADLDVDCDGKETAICNAQTDPWFQNQTSAQDSHGNPLDASVLPYVVIPSKSAKFDYSSKGIQLGQVVAVIYQNKVEYGVFADTGPADIIGESSYAMAQRLGINPDPENGGTDSEVSYIVFTNTSARVSKNEDHDEAVRVGATSARQFLTNN